MAATVISFWTLAGLCLKPVFRPEREVVPIVGVKKSGSRIWAAAIVMLRPAANRTG
jgi:hypothetical protein